MDETTTNLSVLQSMDPVTILLPSLDKLAERPRGLVNAEVTQCSDILLMLVQKSNLSQIFFCSGPSAPISQWLSFREFAKEDFQDTYLSEESRDSNSVIVSLEKRPTGY